MGTRSVSKFGLPLEGGTRKFFDGTDRAFKLSKTIDLGKRTTKPRKITQFISAGNGRKFLVHNNDLETLERGMLERVGGRVIDGSFHPPLVPTHSILSAGKQFRDRCCRRIPNLTPYSYYQVAECMGQKKALYHRERLTLELVPLGPLDSVQTSFIKPEPIDESVKEDPKPRVIRPRSVRFNLALGRYVKSCEKAIYKAIGQVCGGVTVTKGLNAVQTAAAIKGAFDSMKNPAVIPLDASHADQSYGKDCRAYVRSWYQKIFGSDPDLMYLESLRMSVQRIYGNTREGRIMMQGLFGMSSGDGDTSLAMCIVICTMAEGLLNDLSVDFRLIDNGDDHLMIVEREDVERVHGQVEAWYARFGFKVVPGKPIYQLAEIEFCQSFVIYDGTEYTMVRDLRKSISKDLLSLKKIDCIEDFDYYRLAKAECGLSLAGNLPILQSFYNMLGRDARRVSKKEYVEVSGMQFMAKGLDKRGEVTVESRVSFYETFNITPDEQRAIETFYDSITPRYQEITSVEEFTYPIHIPIIIK